MEVTNFNKSIAEVMAKNPELEEFFTEEELLELTNDMVRAVTEVAGQHNVKKIEFSETEEMYCQMIEKRVRLGLGNLVKMSQTWARKLGHTKGNHETAEQVKIQTISSLRSDAAHEGGHAVIDRYPLDLGMAPELFNQAGMQSLQNAVWDCRNDQRIINQHPGLSDDMRTNMDFAFSYGGGRLAWDDPVEQAEKLEELGYTPLFSQFTCEVIRHWAHGEIHPDTDERVRAALESELSNLNFLATSSATIPVANPIEPEVRYKAKLTYENVLDIYGREYEKLVKIDTENQMVHQAADLMGLDHIGYPLHPNLKAKIEEAKTKATPEILEELNCHLEFQQTAKEFKKMEEAPVESGITGIFKKIVKAITGSNATDDLEKTDDFKTTKKSTERELIGPAIQVEPLSPELRKWLMELFKEAKQEADKIQMTQALEQMIKDLLMDPEGKIKMLDEENAEGMKPHTIPDTYPSYKALEDAIEAAQNPPAPLSPSDHSENTNISPDGGGFYLIPAETDGVDMREFPEIEQWLDDNIDMKEKIRQWREAIKAMGKGGSKLQYDFTTDLDMEAIIDDEVRVEAGILPEMKIFRKEVKSQEKVTLSILWRTQAAEAKNTLKLFLFLKRIYEDPEVRKYLDLEVLLSQDVPGIPQEDEAHIPLIIGFGQDPIRDHDDIMDNLHKLKGSYSFPINQDATALEVQRKRLIKHAHPESRRRFTIDIWDEAAVQMGVANPMQAVRDEIGKTREALKDHSFCIVINGGSGNTAKQSYGEKHVLAAKGPVELIDNLDIVVRNMIKSGDDFADAVQAELATKK